MTRKQKCSLPWSAGKRQRQQRPQREKQHSSRLQPQPGKKMLIKVKVERIKERVEEKEGIPPQQQRLIYSGKQMNDEKTAADYKILGGSVLHLVLALRGGGGLGQ